MIRQSKKFRFVIPMSRGLEITKRVVSRPAFWGRAALILIGIPMFVSFFLERAVQGQNRIVNCVAAIVNDGVITRADIELADALELFEIKKTTDAAGRRRTILDRLIDRRIILDQVRDKAVPDPAAVEAERRILTVRIGPAVLTERLGRLGLTEADVRPFLEDAVRYRLIVNDRFGRSVSVSLKEIEAFYDESYSPARKKEGTAVRPLVEVLNALEAEIKRVKVEAQAALWIEAVREQAEVEIKLDCLNRHET
jgi:hypothetical protein